ncbi:MAG: hypothetical protein RR290_00285 [Clostridia bacterium]
MEMFLGIFEISFCFWILGIFAIIAEKKQNQNSIYITTVDFAFYKMLLKLGVFVIPIVWIFMLFGIGFENLFKYLGEYGIIFVLLMMLLIPFAILFYIIIKQIVNKSITKKIKLTENKKQILILGLTFLLTLIYLIFSRYISFLIDKNEIENNKYACRYRNEEVSMWKYIGKDVVKRYIGEYVTYDSIKKYEITIDINADEKALVNLINDIAKGTEINSDNEKHIFIIKNQNKKIQKLYNFDEAELEKLINILIDSNNCKILSEAPNLFTTDMQKIYEIIKKLGILPNSESYVIESLLFEYGINATKLNKTSTLNKATAEKIKEFDERVSYLISKGCKLEKIVDIRYDEANEASFEYIPRFIELNLLALKNSILEKEFKDALIYKINKVRYKSTQDLTILELIQ